MADYQALQRPQHATAGVTPAPDLGHAAHDRAAPVLLDEVPQLLPYMPLGFIRDATRPAGFTLIVLQGLDSSRNLYLHPVTAKWLTGYVPACYRGYPFALGKDASSGRQVLCIDQDSGLLRDPAEPGDIPVFGPDGEPSQSMRDTLAFLQAREAGLARTQQAVDALDRHGLIEPWPLSVEQAEGKTALQGLHRIKQGALSALTGDALAELNGCEALKLAYAQPFSMPRLSHLQKLSRLHSTTEADGQGDNIDALFEAGDEDIHFDFDR